MRAKITQVIAEVGIGEQGESGEAKLWLSQKFAGLWFQDAMREAADCSIDARRREIIFAVTCVESYLLEWVLERVGPQNLDDYLPPGDKSGIAERWKVVLKKLHQSGHIECVPNFCTSAAWRSFVRMVSFRNGLLHARAGRPDTNGLDAYSIPVPKIEDLARLQAGEACTAVRLLIQESAELSGIQPPPWLPPP